MEGNPFQRRLADRLKEVLAGHGIEPHESWCDYRSDARDETDRSAYTRLLFRLHGELCEAWLYIDEAAVSFAGNWYTFERRRFAEDPELVEAVAAFLDACGAGTNPVDAYRAAARIAPPADGGGTGSR
ncbi:MAG: hypothetical protein Kow0062_16260 [Acidobacteriota bacterium]